LLSPNDCLGECVEKLKDDGGGGLLRPAPPDDLRDADGDVQFAREAIDLITVQQNLKNRQLLEQVGGIAYLAQLQDAVPSGGEPGLLSGDRARKVHLLRK
jgi:hypothetical protein